MMSNTRRNIRLGIFLNIGIGIVFLIAAVIAVISVNDGMRRQALMEAESKARIILDRNLATHTYFTKIMKPKIFKWTESFRTKDYFDPTWMSSTFAIREIEKYFKASNPSGYFFKDAALDARSPENEAEGYERLFLEKINADKKLETESSVRRIDGEPFLVVLRRGEVMEASCLKCHANPKDAPKGLIDFYGSERSFNRKVGDAVSAVSLRIPLAEAYAGADIFSLRLSILLFVVLAGLFTTQYLFYRRYLLKPLHVMQEKATQITAHDEHLGEQIPQPLGRELGQLATAFNEMSVKLRHDRDHLEELVEKRTAELKLANERLRRERDFSKSLINTAQVILLVLDTEGRIVNFNPYLEEISGYTLGEVEGRDWFSIFLPESDRQRVREFFLKAVGTFQSKGKVDPILTKDGRLREIEWYDKTLKDTEGRVIGLLAIGHDVTERKRAEETLRESKEFVENLIASMQDGFSVLDSDGVQIDVNAAFCQMTGFSREELIGVGPPHLYWPPEAYEEIEKGFQKTLRGEFSDVELTFMRKNGERFPVIVSPSWVKDKQGNVTNYFATVKDITERKRAEEEKRRLEERSRKVVEDIFRFIPEGVLVFSRKMELLRQNQAFRELVSGYARRLGFAEDELENLIIDKIKAGMGDKNIKEIRISRKHETGK
jgi:PAS domain S-box-containing protein